MRPFAETHLVDGIIFKVLRIRWQKASECNEEGKDLMIAEESMAPLNITDL